MNVKPSNNSDKKGFFSRLKRGLSKTREILTTDIDDLFAGGKENSMMSCWKNWKNC